MIVAEWICNRALDHQVELGVFWGFFFSFPFLFSFSFCQFCCNIELWKIRSRTNLKTHCKKLCSLCNSYLASENALLKLCHDRMYEREKERVHKAVEMPGSVLVSNSPCSCCTAGFFCQLLSCWRGEGGAAKSEASTSCSVYHALHTCNQNHSLWQWCRTDVTEAGKGLAVETKNVITL